MITNAIILSQCVEASLHNQIHVFYDVCVCAVHSYVLMQNYRNLSYQATALHQLNIKI